MALRCGCRQVANFDAQVDLWQHCSDHQAVADSFTRQLQMAEANRLKAARLYEELGDVCLRIVERRRQWELRLQKGECLT